MPVTRLNHAVLYVRNVTRSVAFYTEVLGFHPIERMGMIPGAAFLQAGGSSNDHDLGLFQVGEAAQPARAGYGGSVGLYHLAWEVDTLNELGRIGHALEAHGALVGASDHGTTKSLYGRDPDGIEFEVAWIVPAALLDEGAYEAARTVGPLDLGRETARYGAETPGGVGVSMPAPAAR